MSTTEPGRDRAVIETFVELADTLSGDYDIGEFLQFLVERCTSILNADVAGVLLQTPEGQLNLSAATSEEMRAIEDIELSAGDGPCMDAYRTGDPVIVKDLHQARDRWPGVAQQLLDMGMRSGYAFALALRGDRIGALNLYRRDLEPFDDIDIRTAQAFADIAAIGILQERKVTDAERRTRQLQHALDSRIDIEQATGILVQRHGITPTQAFEALRAYSRSHRLRVHDVSQRIVSGAVDIPIDR